MTKIEGWFRISDVRSQSEFVAQTQGSLNGVGFVSRNIWNNVTRASTIRFLGTHLTDSNINKDVLQIYHYREQGSGNETFDLTFSQTHFSIIPTDGAAAIALTVSDIPTLPASKIGSGVFDPARLAAGGTDGQVLTRTATGQAWETSTGGGGAPTEEQVFDLAKNIVVGGTGISTDDNDNTNRITINRDALTRSDLPSYTRATLTDAANISWNAGTSPNARVTLAGNRTLNSPTGLRPGESALLEIIQDSTGSRTITWPSSFDFIGTAPALSTTASSNDVLVITATTATTFLAKLEKSDQPAATSLTPRAFKWDSDSYNTTGDYIARLGGLTGTFASAGTATKGTHRGATNITVRVDSNQIVALSTNRYEDLFGDDQNGLGFAVLWGKTNASTIIDIGFVPFNFSADDRNHKIILKNSDQTKIIPVEVRTRPDSGSFNFVVLPPTGTFTAQDVIYIIPWKITLS